MQRQRRPNSEDLEQERQVLPVDTVALGVALDQIDECLWGGARFGDRCGGARVVTKPELCLRLAGGSDAEQIGQGIARSPRVGARGVLNEDQHVRCSVSTRYHTDYDRE